MIRQTWPDRIQKYQMCKTKTNKYFFWLSGKQKWFLYTCCVGSHFVKEVRGKTGWDIALIPSTYTRITCLHPTPTSTQTQEHTASGREHQKPFFGWKGQHSSCNMQRPPSRAEALKQKQKMLNSWLNKHTCKSVKNKVLTLSLFPCSFNTIIPTNQHPLQMMAIRLNPLDWNAQCAKLARCFTPPDQEGIFHKIWIMFGENSYIL